MNQMKRSLCALLSALMLLAMLAGCGKKQETDEPFVLGVSVCGAIDSLDPAMNTDTDADSIFYALYENLMRMSDDGSGEAVLGNGIYGGDQLRRHCDLPLHAALIRPLVGWTEDDGG